MQFIVWKNSAKSARLILGGTAADMTLFDAGSGRSKPGQMLMSPKQFRRWRKSLGLKQKDAAELLGLKKRMIQYYEKGERDGKKINIPKYVRLACYALGEGIHDYDGERAREQN